MESNIEELEYQEEWAYPSGGCLNITDDCNLACHYCFVQQKPHYMDLQTAKDAIDWLYHNYEIKKEKGLETEDPYINFFGGEPTLLWDKIIVPLTQYIRTKYNNFNIGMTTNGTLLNKEKIDFLKNNRIGILLSIDGDKETQDLTRPCKNGQSSFDLLFPNIKLLLDFDPNIVFRATINQENVSMMFHNFLFAQQMGFKEFFFSPNEREKWSEENLTILENEVTKIMQYHFTLLSHNIVPPITSSIITGSYFIALNIYDSLTHNSIEELTYHKPTYINRCGIGSGPISISYTGDIFGCQEQDSREDTNNIFKIGNIYNTIDKEKQLQLIKLYKKDINIKCEKENLCKMCKNINRCNDELCPSTSMDLYQNFNTKSEVACRYRNIYINNTLTIINLLSNSQFFQNYIQHLTQGGTKYNGYK